MAHHMQLVLLIKTNYILKSILFGYLLFTSGFVFPSSLTITPDFETEGVGTYFDDAADDPAIWFNNKNPDQSLVFGTDKKQGIYTYSIKGKTLNFSELGSINNIDLRYHNDQLHIVVSNRTTNMLEYWIFEKDIYSTFTNYDNPFTKAKIHKIFDPEMSVYGICMGVVNNQLMALLTEEEGPKIQLWNLDDGFIHQETNINEFERPGPYKVNEVDEAEGCVFDDSNLTVFVSREGRRGELRAYSLPDLNFKVIIDTRLGEILGDPEGLAIYEDDKNGFLILSSQGGSKFNIYDRNEPYSFIKSFYIISNDIDGVQDTDGIAISSENFGIFEYGMMIAQDGYNSDQLGEYESQNFKIISFKKILDALNN